MVLYFTGTGNSRYIAQRIADKLQDELISINDRIKANDKQEIKAQKRIVIITPTYAWRIPRTVKEWLTKTEISGAKQVWFVMNCGAQIGNASKYNKKLCEEKDLAYMGTAQIIMPENYIAMFGVPNAEQARKIVKNAETDIDNAAAVIADNRKLTSPQKFIYKFMSGPLNVVYYPFCVKARAFTVSDACIGCGKCAKLCPLNNITIDNKKPVWGKNCTHCMACISYCPTKAIEYGKKSIGKPRYHFEEL